MLPGELMTLLVLLRFGCIIETVSAESSSTSRSSGQSGSGSASVGFSSNPVTSPSTSPTPIRLIEKYSKQWGRERWISPTHRHDATTTSTSTTAIEKTLRWDSKRSHSISEQQQQRLELVRRRRQEEWKQHQFAGGGGGGSGIKKRAAPSIKETEEKNAAEKVVEDKRRAQCEAFEVGDREQKILYSPGYPGNYPNNTNCTVILEAPPGYLIRLDFRDYFHLEPSEDCKFDSLQIRDGGFGYSTLLGTYCGEEFPPIITSRERRLWLRFKSDENIEYSGFVIVYEFITRPNGSLFEDTSCRFELTGQDGWVNSTSIEKDQLQAFVDRSLPIDCMWVITVEPHMKIQIAFQHFALTNPNDCESNFVDVFGTETDIPSRIKNFCGSIADSVTSPGNMLHIRFYAEISAAASKFEILFTAFRQLEKGQTCDEQEYDCEDSTCIHQDLKCDGKVNCRFRWDEECEEESHGPSDHVIIVIVVFTLILSTIFIAFIISCCQKLIRDHKIIRDHIRQSKESKLDELGRHSTKWSEKQQIQFGDLECMSIKYPPPPLSPITRKEVINDAEDSESAAVTSGMDRYGFHSHAMPLTSSMKGSTTGLPSVASYDLKGSVANIQANEYEMERFHHHHHHPHPHHQQQQQQQQQHHSMKYQQPASNTQSIGTAADSDASGAMCDMACQTRESLFQPIFNSTSQTPVTASSGHPRFSTFGYDQHRAAQQHQQQQHTGSSGGAGSSSIGSGNSSFTAMTNDGGGGGDCGGVVDGQSKHGLVSATTIELPYQSHKQQQQQHQQHHRHCQHHPAAAQAAASSEGSVDQQQQQQQSGDRGKSLPRRQNNNNNNQAFLSNRPNDQRVKESGGGGSSQYSDVRKSAPDVIVMTSR